MVARVELKFLLKKYLWIMIVLGLWTSALAIDRNGLAGTNEVPSWAKDQLELRDLVRQQIYATMKWQDANGTIFTNLSQYKWDDEVEIFYSWMIYYQLSGDETVYQSVRAAALNYLQRVAFMFDHGYFKEPYFDTEHTLEGLVILANLVYLKPQDRDLVQALEDIVEHVGNWVPGYTPWFDPDTRHLKSVRPGTQKIDSDCPAAVDWVFNLQFAKMALALYYATENERYLNWVGEYNSGWLASIEKNERENGYYVIPSEVDPVTGQIGSCSGKWYQSAFEPGWGWNAKGNNANRDLRGAFLDYYRITQETAYLDCMKKQMVTLFQNGSGNEPAHFFDGVQWRTDSDKITAYMSIQSSLVSPEPDETLDNYLLAWYYLIPYHFPEMHYWFFRKHGDMKKINDIHSHAIRSAKEALAEIEALKQLPGQPDEFPKMSGYWALSLVPFGGISALRGEMPWTEVLFFKEDRTLGLPEGVAALVDHADDAAKVFWLSNTNASDRFITVQANFIPASIYRLSVNAIASNDFDAHRVRIRVPANETVLVEVGIGMQDTLPPNPPRNLRQDSASENTIQLAWDLPVPAQDGDQAHAFKIFRDGVEVAYQNKQVFRDSLLTESTSFQYEVYAIDKSQNVSLTPARARFATSADLTAPTLVSVIAINASTVQLSFSEALESASAVNKSNYSIDPTLAIQQVQLVGDDKIVWLQTQPQSPDITYHITVVNVADKSKARNRMVRAVTMAYVYTVQLKVEQISRSGYYLKSHILGDPVYSDRQYRSTVIPQPLSGLDWLVTANDDKILAGDNFLSFMVNKKVTLYIGYDQSQIDVPAWLIPWEKTGLTIKSEDTDFSCYRKEWQPGLVQLGANNGHNSTSMYLILLDDQPDRIPPAAPAVPTLLFRGSQ